MKKIVTLFLIPIIALSLIGASYALWSKTITLDGTVNTGFVEKKVTEVFCSDAETIKNVGTCTSEIGVGGDSASFIIDDAYPGYIVDFTFKETNTGTIPVKIMGVTMFLYDIDGNTIDSAVCTGLPCAMNTNGQIIVSYMDNFGVQIDPGVTVANSINAEVLQGAVQASGYSVTVKETAGQWNE